MEIRKKLENWPSLVFLILALIPLAMLIFIVVNLVIKSQMAVSQIGFFGYGKLFSTEIAGVFSVVATGIDYWGLLPGIWGTILVVGVAMLIAVPVSLAIAVFASEFTLGILGKGIRSLLGILGGIPEIIYALFAVAFAQLFIIPKFCGTGIPGNQMPPAGMWWWKPGSLPFYTSTLLGGIMLALLITPFLAPLFDDAIRDVPHTLKEASLSLGATRWQTLRKVILPHAFPGIFSAASLGILKAMGEVVIVGAVVGFQTGIPNPLFDILKSTAPLTATGAGFAGGFSQSVNTPLRDSVSNFTGLLLIVIAFAVLILVTFLQSRFKRRYS